jgi:hypothetical protein
MEVLQLTSLFRRDQRLKRLQVHFGRPLQPSVVGVHSTFIAAQPVPAVELNWRGMMQAVKVDRDHAPWVEYGGGNHRQSVALPRRDVAETPPPFTSDERCMSQFSLFDIPH